MARYRWILVFAVLGALAVSILLRMPQRAVARTAAPAQVDTLAVAVDVFADHVETQPQTFAVGRTVALTVTNHRAAPLRFALTGYQDCVPAAAIAPNAPAHITFIANRPGDQFAWLIDGSPMGRLDIRGSHLVEGHQ